MNPCGTFCESAQINYQAQLCITQIESINFRSELHNFFMCLSHTTEVLRWVIIIFCSDTVSMVTVSITMNFYACKALNEESLLVLGLTRRDSSFRALRMNEGELPSHCFHHLCTSAIAMPCQHNHPVIVNLIHFVFNVTQTNPCYPNNTCHTTAPRPNIFYMWTTVTW